MRLIKIFLMLFLIVLGGCNTTKKTTETFKKEVQIDSARYSFSKELENKEVSLNDKLLLNNTFRKNTSFTISSKDSLSPAKIVEYRMGVPYRELQVTNGSYTESTDSTSKKLEEKDKIATVKIEANRENINITIAKVSELTTKVSTLEKKLIGLTNLLYIVFGILFLICIFVAYFYLKHINFIKKISSFL